MKNKPLKYLGIMILISIISFLVYWAGISAPNKTLTYEVEYVEYQKTGEVSPWYKIYYEWDGVRQPEAWWVITRKDGRLVVIELKDVVSAQAEGITDFQKLSNDFNFRWVRDHKFTPQPTRYEGLLLLMGAQPMYDKELDVFLEILKKEE